MTWAKRYHVRLVRRVLPHDMSDEDALKIHAEATRRLNDPKRLLWLVPVLLGVMCFVVVAVSVPAIRHMLDPLGAWVTVLIGGAAGGVIAWIHVRPFPRHIRQVGCERGYPVCLNCGHALPADLNETACCPECGTPRDTVGRESP